MSLWLYGKSTWNYMVSFSCPFKMRRRGGFLCSGKPSSLPITLSRAWRSHFHVPDKEHGSQRRWRPRTQLLTLGPADTPAFFLQENFQEVLCSVVKSSRLEFLLIVRLQPSILAKTEIKIKLPWLYWTKKPLLWGKNEKSLPWPLDMWRRPEGAGRQLAQ